MKKSVKLLSVVCALALSLSACTIHIKLVPASSSSASAGGITLAEYSQIKNGMTYDEVCDIVGGAGRVVSEAGTGRYYSFVVVWDGAGSTIGANANVLFQNGKVVSKAQAGLM